MADDLVTGRNKKIVLRRQSGDVHESMKMSLVHIFHLKEKGNGL